MKSEQWIFVIWSLLFWDICILNISNITVPKITKIVVENWEELRFKLQSQISDVNIWNAWFTNSKNSNNPNSYKKCNHSKDDSWTINDPFDKVSSDSVIIIGLSQTNSAVGIVLSNLTSIDLKDYVRPGIVTKVKFQLLRDVKNINALYFQTPTYRQNMTFSISINCLNGYKECFTATYKRFDPHAFTKFKDIPRYTTCNISIRGISSDFRGFWSNEVIEVVRTEMSVPMAAPKLSRFGGFTVLLIDSESLDVVIHFKGLTRDEARGPLQRYRAHLLSSSKMFRIETSPSKSNFRELNKNDSNILIDRSIVRDFYGHKVLGSFDNDDGEEEDDDDFFFSSDQDTMEFHFDRNNKLHYLGNFVDDDDMTEFHSDRPHDDKEEKEQVAYLEITNNQDYERVMKLLSSGNVSVDHLLSPSMDHLLLPSVDHLMLPSTESAGKIDSPHLGKKMVASDTGDHYSLSNIANNMLEADRSFDVDSVFILKGLNTSTRHSVSLDVMTRRGYNDTVELVFIDLPNFEDFKELPGVQGVDVVFSNKSTYIFWEVRDTDTTHDLVHTIYFCPEKYFHLDGKGCLKFIDWFQVKISSSSSSSSPIPTERQAGVRYRQEIKFPDSTKQETRRSFAFGVSVSLRSGLSRGVTWRSCEHEYRKDPIPPRVNIFNITFESARVTIDRPKCQFGSGYIFALNVSYCTLQNDADNVCSGTHRNFVLHPGTTKFDLKNLKERQAYLLSVEVSSMDSVTESPPGALRTGPYILTEEQVGLIHLHKSQKSFRVIDPVFSRPTNMIHFMTAEKPLPSTQVVLIHPSMVAFLAIIGVFILALLLLGFFVVFRLYRKSVRKFNEWNTVRIEPPHQELVQSRDDALLPVNVDIPVRGNDYSAVAIIRVEQNILPLLNDLKHHTMGSDSDFKMGRLSLRSTTSDSFKSFSEADDLNLNERADDFVSILLTENRRKLSSSPFLESSTNSKPGMEDKKVERKHRDHVLDKKSFLSDRLFSTPTKLTKTVRPLNHSTLPDRMEAEELVEKIDADEGRGMAFSRVLPPITKQQIVPTAAVVPCFPILKLETLTTQLKTLQEKIDNSHFPNPSHDISLSPPSHQTTSQEKDDDYDLLRCTRPSDDDENDFRSNVLFGSLTSLNNIQFSDVTSLSTPPSSSSSSAALTAAMPSLLQLSDSKSSSSSFSSLAASPPSSAHHRMINVGESSLIHSQILPRMNNVTSRSIPSTPSSLTSSSSNLLTISSMFDPLSFSSKSLTAPQTQQQGNLTPLQKMSKDDGYTGCKEHSVLPIRIDEVVLRQPAIPIPLDRTDATDDGGVME